MKKLFVILTAILLTFTASFSQSEKGPFYKMKTSTAKYHPSSDGYNGFPISVKMRVKMDAFFQEPITMSVASGKILDDSRVYFEGKWYNKADFEPKVWKDISFSNQYDIEVDVYQGAARVSTMKYNGIIDVDLLAASPDWDEVFPGLSEAQAKYLYKNGYTLQNMRVVDLEDQFRGFYLLESAIRKRENKTEALKQAKTEEGKGNLEEAIKQYKIAKKNAENDAEEQEIEKIIKALTKELEDESAMKDLLQNAKNNIENDNLEAAENNFEEILKIDPQNAEARKGLNQVKTKRKDVASNKLKEEATQARSNGDNETAKKKLDEALAIDPNNAEAATMKTEILEEERIERRDTWRDTQEQKAQAEDAYNQAAYTEYSSSVGILASLLFMNMGNDGPSNRFKHSGMNFRLAFDFNVTDIPVSTSSETYYYDGDEYRTSYYETTNNMSTLNVALGMEWGIVRSSVLDLGIQGRGMYGMGIDGETILSYSFGANVAVGFKGFKLFSKCNVGNMSGGFDNFDYYGGTSFNSGGYFDEAYKSLEFGVRILFKGWGTTSYIEASSITVNTDFEYSNGMKFSYGATNRMQVAVEYFPSWYLTGEGSYYKIGLVRTFDFF